MPNKTPEREKQNKDQQGKQRTTDQGKNPDREQQTGKKSDREQQSGKKPMASQK